MYSTRPNITTTSPPPLSINIQHNNNTVTTSIITATQSYRYLGVIFNPKLGWKNHTTNVEVKATHWTQQLWRISKTVDDLAPK